MAWEWVTPVAPAVGGIVGAGIGAGFTYLAGEKGRQHVEKMAEKTAASQLALARDARKVQAYEDLMALMIDVALIYPEDPSQLPPAPDIPTTDQIRERLIKIVISVGLHGSREVKDLANKWDELVMALFLHDRKFQMAETNRPDLVPLSDDEYKKTYQELSEAAQALRARMHSELTS
ncbi:hypothetical protein [Nonomuraea wenchangensis]|nr:hypothetical protein [Nonomuraea wenchangensis]